MELRILIEPQFGATYEQQLAIAQAAERHGYPALFRSDHFVNTAGGDGLPGPSDAWVALGAIARETESIRLGTLVTSANFRLPGPLAVAVSQVDQMSGGRIEFGLGAGWFDREHAALGMPFPPMAERLDRLEEQLEIVTRFWATPAGETFSHDGKHYQLTDCPALPKPAQEPHPPIIVGGSGRNRPPALAARYADEFNIGLVDPPETAAQFERVRAACKAIDRDPESLVYSAATTVCCGTTQAEAHRRAAESGIGLDELREIGIAGTPAEVSDWLQAYEAIGAQRFYLRLLDLTDLEHVALIAEDVLPNFA